MYFLQMRSHLAQAVSLRKRVTRLTLQFGRKKMSFRGRGKEEIYQLNFSSEENQEQESIAILTMLTINVGIDYALIIALFCFHLFLSCLIPVRTL